MGAGSEIQGHLFWGSVKSWVSFFPFPLPPVSDQIISGLFEVPFPDLFLICMVCGCIYLYPKRSRKFLRMCWPQKSSGTSSQSSLQRTSGEFDAPRGPSGVLGLLKNSRQRGCMSGSLVTTSYGSLLLYVGTKDRERR